MVEKVKKRFSVVYLLVAIFSGISLVGFSWVVLSNVFDALTDLGDWDSWYWILGYLIIGGSLGFLIYFWLKSQKKAKFTKARKITAVALLVFLIPMSVGLPTYRIVNEIPQERGPYLSWTRDPTTTMTITWEMQSETYDSIVWGVSVDVMTAQETAIVSPVRSDDGYFHYTITLTELTGGTEYWYKVEGVTPQPLSFKTAPTDQSTKYKFLAYGDSRETAKLGDNQHIPLIKQALDINAPTDYAFSINTGDLAYEYDAHVAWDLHFYAIEDLASRSPYFAAAGNHEWDTSKNWDNNQTAHIIQEFPKTEYPGESIGSLNGISYAFGYGDVYFIQLGYPHAGANNTEHPEVNTWLNDQLAIANSSYQFTVVSFHRPPFDDRVGTSSDDNEDIIRNQVPLFHYGGVDVVINGHNHVLARHNITMDDDPISGRQVTYLTAGGGGASLRDYEAGSWDNKYGLGFRGQTETSADIAKTYHFYVCEVDPVAGTLVFTGYDMKGNIVDYFTQYSYTKI